MNFSIRSQKLVLFSSILEKHFSWHLCSHHSSAKVERTIQSRPKRTLDTNKNNKSNKLDLPLFNSLKFNKLLVPEISLWRMTRLCWQSNINLVFHRTESPRRAEGRKVAELKVWFSFWLFVEETSVATSGGTRRYSHKNSSVSKTTCV